MFIHKKSCVSADIIEFRQTLRIPVADESSCREGAQTFTRNLVIKVRGKNCWINFLMILSAIRWPFGFNRHYIRECEDDVNDTWNSNSIYWSQHEETEKKSYWREKKFQERTATIEEKFLKWNHLFFISFDADKKKDLRKIKSLHAKDALEREREKISWKK